MTDQTTLRAAILAAVPDDGSTISNQSLFERLRGQFPQLAEDEYWSVRDALIDGYLLAKGRGRGGSVRRAEAATPAQLDAFSLAEQALNQARARFAPTTEVSSDDLGSDAE